MRDFKPPKITTKDQLGEINLDVAFQLHAKYDPARTFDTLRGGRFYQAIIGGTVSGPKLNGKLYPDSGGQYDFRRPDRVRDINARFMLNADDGEWIYVSHIGYRRSDGYYRVAAYFDADTEGPHAWLNDSVVIATGRESVDGNQVTFTYYEAL